MRIKLSFMILALSVIMLYSNSAYWEYHPEPGRVFFLKNKYIEMVWEKVSYKNEIFTTVFMFKNTSKITQSVKIAFPIKSNWDDYYDAYGKLKVKNPVKTILDYVTNEMAFQSFINGKVLERQVYYISNTSGKDLEYDVIYLGKIDFLPGESLIESNVYYQKPAVIGMNSDQTEFYRINYILKSGATWKGPIKKAEIQIKIPYEKLPFSPYNQMFYSFAGTWHPYFKKYFLSIEPKPKELIDTGDGFLIKWSFLNFIPIKNICVDFGWSSYFVSEGSSIPEFLFESKNQKVNYYTYDLFSHIIKMVREENNTFFFISNSLLVNELQNKERFYQFIIAMGLGIIQRVEEENELSPYLTDYDNAIRFVINGINAVHGYKFKKIFWQNFFKKFPWYKAEKGNIEFPPEEEEFVQKLLKYMEKIEKLNKKMEQYN